ncbi:MAG: ABC transporter permease [Acidothermus cellulolyticus]|nr:ABC transporter permease [Acidothermus cellulolyticus]
MTEAILRRDTRQASARRLRIPVVEIVSYVGGLLIAFGIGAIVFAALGASPLGAYGTIIHNSIGSVSAISQTLNKTTPLLLGSAAVAMGMRGGLLNIGVDGQIYAGAIMAMWVAFGLTGAPRIVQVTLPILAAVAGGGLCALLPAMLRYRLAVNEFFTTVMLNFVGMYLAQWLATDVWNDPLVGNAVSKRVPSSVDLPTYNSMGGDIGIVVAVVVVIGIQFWLSRTRHGFEFNAMSVNPVAARMAGVSPLVVVMIGLVGGGLVAGLAGGLLLTGSQFVLFNGFSQNYGYMSVLAAVLARRNAVYCIPVAFFLACLLVGSSALQATIRLPASAVLFLEGVVVLAILVGVAIARRSKFLARFTSRRV